MISIDWSDSTWSQQLTEALERKQQQRDRLDRAQEVIDRCATTYPRREITPEWFPKWRRLV